MERTKIKDLLARTDFGAEVCVKGWVRTRRGSKSVNFIALNDGSCLSNVQIVADVEKFDPELLKLITTGACLSVEGTLVASQGGGQAAEIQASAIEVLGACGNDYPMQKKGQTFEYMRQHAHLRLRTNTFGAIFRIRHHMAMAIHRYFHEHGYFYFHTPIITSSDAEGAGQMFQVTTKNLYDLKKDEEGHIDYSDDFFGESTCLTVSGQLEGELGATALGAIYTFGPTFRAENSNTTTHAAEFWMIEPEMAFADLDYSMDVIEDMLKYCINYVMEMCPEELAFFNERIDTSLLERLEHVRTSTFKRLPYTEAIEILKNADVKFENNNIHWGMDLNTEHERYITEKVVKGPTFLIDYPEEIKAFYMRRNDDGKTVAACDLLVPGVGELVGGSQREERLDILEKKMESLGMNVDSYQWYLDLRRYGGCQHAGFGLGFERLVMYITGMENIRDVIPFARTPRNLNF